MSVTVVDTIMGGGKTTWVIDEILNKNFEKNILYITPYLTEVKRIIDTSKRKIYEPQCKGSIRPITPRHIAKKKRPETDLSNSDKFSIWQHRNIRTK